MRADELMIGDWVFHYVGGEEKIKPVQVIGISFDGIQGVYQKYGIKEIGDRYE